MKSSLHITGIFLLLSFLGFGQIQLGQTINGEASGDRFGESISLSSNGTIVAIGGNYNDDNGSNSGHVRVYENIEGVWIQIGQDIHGEAAGDQFGGAVSLSSNGSILAVGASNNDGDGFSQDSVGHVKIFENIGGVWLQIGSNINGENSYDLSGGSVSLSSDGTNIAIGAEGSGGFTGQVRIFENVGGVWTQVGQDIDGETNDDRFGNSVSLSSDGTKVAIGAFRNDYIGSNSGHVRIFENIGGIWTQLGQDINGDASSNLGYSVSLSSDGTIVAIGAPFYNNIENAGYVRVYESVGGIWTQLGQDINGDFLDDFFGWNVSINGNGDIIAVGAPGNDFNGTTSGQVKIFKNISNEWNQIGDDIHGNMGDAYGESTSLSLDGSIVSFGAIFANGSGQALVFDLDSVLSSDDIVLSQFNLFPNPAQDIFTIDIKEDMIIEKINIYNQLGQFLTTTKEKVIRTNNFSSGIYYVEIVTTKGKATKKLVIE